MDRTRAGLTLVLVLMGAGWGLTTPLTKIAVSQGYRHFGLIFWQLVLSVLALGLVQLIRRRSLRVSLRREHLRVYLVVALLGTILSDAAGYTAAVHLPSGILSVTLSMAPMFVFAVALAWGMDRVRPLRLLGLLCGLAGVLILTLPGASMNGTVTIWLLLFALFAPMCYGFEGNYVARYGTAGLDPVETLYGASTLGMVIALPVALLSGAWISPLPPWGAPDAALVASSVIHAAVYTTYVWMVGRAGAVFAAQVSYLVTGFGVAWAMLLLDERYAPGFWLALGLMLVGLALVRPRDHAALAKATEAADNERKANGAAR